jgi:hypothetical protein
VRVKREGIMAEAILIFVLFVVLALHSSGPAWLRAGYAVCSFIWAYIAGRRSRRDWNAVNGRDQNGR